MAYAKPIDVYDALQLKNAVYKKSLNDGNSVSNGDVIDLENKNIITDGVLSNYNLNVSSDRSVALFVGGTLQAPSDYDLDQEKGELEYTGSDTGAPEASYFYTSANIPSRIVEDKLDAATQKIDNQTNTTFNGKKTVTKEVYSGTGSPNEVYILSNRPVTGVSLVEVNDAERTASDSWESASSGGGNDYLVIENLGIEFIDGEEYPRERPHSLRVSYTYGRTSTPDDIKELSVMMVIEDLMKYQIFASNTKGRDNFDPETTNIMQHDKQSIIDKYRIASHSRADYNVQ